MVRVLLNVDALVLRVTNNGHSKPDSKIIMEFSQVMNFICSQKYRLHVVDVGCNEDDIIHPHNENFPIWIVDCVIRKGKSSGVEIRPRLASL